MFNPAGFHPEVFGRGQGDLLHLVLVGLFHQSGGRKVLEVRVHLLRQQEVELHTHSGGWRERESLPKQKERRLTIRFIYTF